MIGPRTCWCCGEREATSGCILGTRCGCNGSMAGMWDMGCFACHKCRKHCKCTKDELQQKHTEIIDALARARAKQHQDSSI